MAFISLEICIFSMFLDLETLRLQLEIAFCNAAGFNHIRIMRWI